MTAKDLDETLKTITANAKAMRDAGIVGKVALDRIEFELAGPEPAPPMVPLQQGVADDPNPLDDEDTYGGVLPRRREPRPVVKE